MLFGIIIQAMVTDWITMDKNLYTYNYVLKSLTKNYLLLISSIGNSSIYLFEQTDMAFSLKRKHVRYFIGEFFE